jgi:hypothetical protein
MSVGTYITFGKFRTMHLGDITKNKEFELMCPVNRIGTVDAVPRPASRRQNTSNSEVMVHATAPARGHHEQRHPQGRPTRRRCRCCIPRPASKTSGRCTFSQLSGQEYTVPGMFIANVLDEPSAAMPVAPIAAPRAGPERAAAARPQRAGLLDQADGASRTGHSPSPIRETASAKTYTPNVGTN